MVLVLNLLVLVLKGLVLITTLHLSALEVRFSRRGAIQIDHLYLYDMTMFTTVLILSDPYHIELKRKRKANGMADFLKDVNKMPPFAVPPASGK